MASYGPSLAQKSFRAAATLSAYRVVTPDTALAAAFVRLIQIPSTTFSILGVSQQSATTDQATPVISFGYTKVTGEASISAGALLTFVTTTGRAIALAGQVTTTINTAGAALPKLLGIALQNGTATDAVVEIYLNVSNVDTLLRIA